jgi:glutamine amidotransferase
MIGIVNTGFGNINSIANIFFENNIDSKFIECKKDFVNVSKIILPGIGKFDTLINKLNHLNIIDDLNDFVLKKEIPILGICIGMHIFYESSAEGCQNGLGWIRGKIEKLSCHETRLPHMGWNKLYNLKGGKIFKNIEEGSSFYFLHSYGNKTGLELDCNHHTYTNHGIDFISSIEKKNIFGVQFHPEKSHKNGIRLLTNFSKLNG